MGRAGVEVRVDEDLVEYLCRLGRVKLSSEERRRLVREIEILLDYINDIFDIEGVENLTPLLYPGVETHVRRDEPVKSEGRVHLSNAILENGFVKAPRVVED